MTGVDVLRDAFGRLPGLVRAAVDGLSPQRLRWAPAPGANTAGWLVWHLTRVQDSHLAELTGEEQVYLTGGWAARFGRAPDPADTGYGHGPADVAAVRPDGAAALLGYHAAVQERTVAYLDRIGDADLDRVADPGWDPPVTCGVRLVSVYDDAAQHAGQAAYLRGLPG